MAVKLSTDCAYIHQNVKVVRSQKVTWNVFHFMVIEINVKMAALCNKLIFQVSITCSNSVIKTLRCKCNLLRHSQVKTTWFAC